MNKIYIIGVIVVLVVIIAIAQSLHHARPSRCQDHGVSAVFSCSDGSLMVVSKLVGAGYKIIRPDGSELNCPVIREPSRECIEALNICSDENLC